MSRLSSVRNWGFWLIEMIRGLCFRFSPSLSVIGICRTSLISLNCIRWVLEFMYGFIGLDSFESIYYYLISLNKF